jgi:hypothetical protein
MPESGLNQSTIDEFTGQAGITTSADGQNQYYVQNINVINLLQSIVSGVIFIGEPLQNMGMDTGLALSINAILGLDVALDLLLFWRGIHW